MKGRPQHDKNLIKQWREVTLPKTYGYLKEKYPDKKNVVWFQGEIRNGTKTRTACQRRIASTSYKQIKQTGFRNSYVYGAFNLQSGEQVGMVFSEFSNDFVNIHHCLFSQAVAQGHHALLAIDCTGWHSISIGSKNSRNYFST